ncbi:MAG: GGDEF domain-containing protein [Verrucomicrobiota bacterium]
MTLPLDQTDPFLKAQDQAKDLEACLVVVRGQQQGRRFFLTREKTLVGRDTGSDLEFMDQQLSRVHAQFQIHDGTVWVTDLNSSNGTLLNGRRLSPSEPARLAKEDVLQIGSTVLKYIPAGDIETLLYGRLEDQAYSDPLTGAHNKRYFTEILEAEFERARGLGRPLSLAILDLDCFKLVNDNHGHHVGDLVLQTFATRAMPFVGPGQIFARYGGEEFVALFPGARPEESTAVAEAIRNAVAAEPFSVDGEDLPITVSIGVARFSGDMEKPEDLIKTADEALYASKHEGRNRVTLANPAG